LNRNNHDLEEDDKKMESENYSKQSLLNKRISKTEPIEIYGRNQSNSFKQERKVNINSSAIEL
jgi:hypothetical protein